MAATVLGWDELFLPRAARWLLEQHQREGGTDLGRCIVVVPAARAGRRLLELLAEPEHRLLIPPRIVTAGQLPALLMKPALPLASPLQVMLLRMRALKDADPHWLTQIIPHLPAPEDFNRWLSLADELTSLDDQLAAQCLHFAQVPAILQQRTDLFQDHRWEALAMLQEQYESTLHELGLTDLNRAAARALEHNEVSCEAHIFLLACVDLPRLHQRMLSAVAREGPDQVTALVHAPQEHAAGFNDLGCMVHSYWQDRPAPLTDDQILVVDKPEDQVTSLLQMMSPEADSPSASGVLCDRFRPDQITIGLGDETLASHMERTLKRAGVPARSGLGRPLAQSRPAMLLAALAAFHDSQRFDDLASLLRHPDLERTLEETLGPELLAQADASAWLTLLQDYMEAHLQQRVGQQWLGDSQRIAALKACYQWVSQLIPQAPGRRLPLRDWPAILASALQTAFGSMELQRDQPEDSALIHALEAITRHLRDVLRLPDAGSKTAWRVTASEAVALLQTLWSTETVPAEAGEPAAEILGWLELPLDDAPAVLVTSCNEKHIPRSRVSDAFLPDAARTALGLEDDQHRLTRDRLLLHALAHSHAGDGRVLRVLASRHSQDRQPLTPSRLLLESCDDQATARRIAQFYAEDHRQPSPPLVPSGEPGILIPLPEERPPLDTLRVTAFREYLADPYRFYLKHVLKLRPRQDNILHARELSGASFGTLAHDILQAFGRSPLRDETDAGKIEPFLLRAMEQEAGSRFGRTPGAALQLQLEQLRYRLQAFARWQAHSAHEGWRIVPHWLEKDFQRTWLIDGQAFTLTGRIDRIDQHPVLGYRVMDYKTADRGDSPEKTHRAKGEWIDLQLPLYRTLLQPQEGFDATLPLQLGYVLLPKTIERIGWSPAPWKEDDLGSAEQKAAAIIRALRSALYWPPAKPPRYPDGYEYLCLDSCLDRSEVIVRAQAKARVQLVPAGDQP